MTKYSSLWWFRWETATMTRYASKLTRWKPRNASKVCFAGMGNAKPVRRSSAVERCRLYRVGYEIYLQGRSSYFFVNPIPRPELFQSRDLNEYMMESQQM